MDAATRRMNKAAGRQEEEPTEPKELKKGRQIPIYFRVPEGLHRKISEKAAEIGEPVGTFCRRVLFEKMNGRL